MVVFIGYSILDAEVFSRARQKIVLITWPWESEGVNGHLRALDDWKFHQADNTNERRRRCFKNGNSCNLMGKVPPLDMFTFDGKVLSLIKR